MDNVLRILPGNIANMIAAGEVVQRPASVVKELMENSVDAGATSVNVMISDAGRTLIRVIDNGCGMSSGDAALCFERHATSKISTAEDLDNILTYGFRGEALASIAAVSEVTLKTRRPQDEVATLVCAGNGADVSVEETSAPVGSNFAVRNLFFNTPARRKFLKSDNVEFRHIVDEFTRVALTRPEIAFSLSHNGKDVYVLRAAKSLKFRIMDILGTSVSDEMVAIDTKTSIINISGFVGSPASARKTLGNQYFFLNGRYFRSPYLHKAVMKAYEGFIPADVTPSYFLYLEADPHNVDINIHPTKTEVKFEDDYVIFQTVFASVREILGKNAFGAEIDFEAAAAVDLPVIGGRFEEYRPVEAPAMEVDKDYDPFASMPFAQSYTPPRTPVVDRGPGDCSVLFEGSVKPVAAEALVLHGKYLIAPARSGMMTIHIRRARERVLFEKFLNVLARGERASQATLFPVQIKLTPSSMLLIEENSEMLRSLGFAICPLGDDSVVVEGVPEGFSCEPGKVKEMMDRVLMILADNSASLSRTMTSELAAKMAVCGASGASESISQSEAQHLIESLLACENAEFTSSGKRIIAITPMEEIDRDF